MASLGHNVLIRLGEKQILTIRCQEIWTMGLLKEKPVEFSWGMFFVGSKIQHISKKLPMAQKGQITIAVKPTWSLKFGGCNIFVCLLSIIVSSFIHSPHNRSFLSTLAHRLVRWWSHLPKLDPGQLDGASAEHTYNWNKSCSTQFNHF